MARKIADCRSLKITAPKDVVKGDFVFDTNTKWGGFAKEEAKAGEKVVIDKPTLEEVMLFHVNKEVI